MRAACEILACIQTKGGKVPQTLSTLRSSSFPARAGCRLRPKVHRRDVRNRTSQPRDKLLEAELVRVVEDSDETVGRLRIRRQARAVDGKKRVRGGERRPLVAVDEGMVLREALPECGGFLDQVGVMPRLRSVQGGLQEAGVPDARGATISQCGSFSHAAVAAVKQPSQMPSVRVGLLMDSRRSTRTPGSLATLRSVHAGGNEVTEIIMRTTPTPPPPNGMIQLAHRKDAQTCAAISRGACSRLDHNCVAK